MSNTPTDSASLALLVVGSCRLQGVAEMMSEDFLCHADCTSTNYGFTHTSVEALQYVRWRSGALEIPEALWPCVCSGDYNTPPEFPHADAAVLEISHTHPVLFDGFALQLNRLRDFLKPTPELWRIWRQYAVPRNLQVRLAALEKCPEFATVDACRRAILERAVMVTQTVDMLREDLQALQAILPPQMVVMTHGSMGEDKLMTSRNKAITAITKACAAEGITLIDPTQHVSAFGTTAQAFAEDIHHYGDAFSLYLSQTLADILALSTRPHSPTEKKRLLNRRLKGAHLVAEPHYALGLAEALLTVAPSSALAWEVKARVYTHLHNPDFAAHSWDRLLRLVAPSAELYMEAARSAEQLGDYPRVEGLLARWRTARNDAQLSALEEARLLTFAQQPDAALAQLTAHAAANMPALRAALAGEAYPSLWGAVLIRALGAEFAATERQAWLEKLLHGAIEAAREGAHTREMHHLRAALFLAGDDADMTMRVRAAITAALSNATSCATHRPTEPCHALRIRALLAFEPALIPDYILLVEHMATNNQYIPATVLAEMLLPHTNEALLQHFLDVLGKATKAALREGDFIAATAYVDVLQLHASNWEETSRIVASYTKHATRRIREVNDIAAARHVWRHDPTNIHALRALSFSDSTPLEERTVLLQKLIEIRTSSVKLIRQAAEQAASEGNYAAVHAYITALLGAANDSKANKKWQKDTFKELLMQLRQTPPESPATIEILARTLDQLSPDSPAMLRAAAHALGKTGDWSTAYHYAHRLATLTPDDPASMELFTRTEKHYSALAPAPFVLNKKK